MNEKLGGTRLPPVFAAPKFCIYCNATDCKLTDEHVVPFAFWGYLVLPQSSCEDCARTTGFFEQQVLTKDFDFLRQALKAPSRKKRVREKFVTVKGQLIPLQRKEIPLSTVLPTTSRPSILHDLSIFDSRRTHRFLASSANMDAAMHHTTDSSPLEYSMQCSDKSNFYRMLAKIGLSYFRCFYQGPYNFTALQSIILGTNEDVFELVGCVEFDSLAHDTIWQISLKTQQSLSGKNYIGVEITMCGFMSRVTYFVVIAEENKFSDFALVNRTFCRTIKFRKT